MHDPCDEIFPMVPRNDFDLVLTYFKKQIPLPPNLWMPNHYIRFACCSFHPSFCLLLNLFISENFKLHIGHLLTAFMIPIAKPFRVLANAPRSVPDAPKSAGTHRFPKWRVPRTRTNLPCTHLWNAHSVTPGTVSGEVNASLIISLHSDRQWPPIKVILTRVA